MFAIHFDDKTSAGQAADNVREHGFDVELQPQEGSRSVVLVASPTDQVSTTVDEAVAVLDEVATKHGGSLMGYGGMHTVGLSGIGSSDS